MTDEQRVPAEYAFLLILRAEGRNISNSEMDELYHVRLVSPNYEKLNADGLVFTDKEKKPYRHRITEKGLAALRRPLPAEAGPGEERGAGAKRARGETKQLYWAAAVAQQRYIQNLRIDRDGAEPVDEEPVDLEGRVRETYAKLAGRAGAWVDLAALRPFFREVPKDELDKVLVHMLDASEVELEPDPLRGRVGPAQQEAAVRVNGEDRHKLAIGRP
ncbi:hypothetical protein GCM10010172_57850 [Paractinoplanes ferrugineus]|uniref:Uncharacterized protein n=1 Tax=Paractinoplanes ferrugineus TaxID=113564 RepID=A0A919J6T5_9ACTN|nr:hypothetical protein [Actinoplanes ferrugineus]GIE15911.1 hypothetical protein Afe05nite_77510 [Actinoplanes ferrugineus]